MSRRRPTARQAPVARIALIALAALTAVLGAACSSDDERSPALPGITGTAATGTATASDGTTATATATPASSATPVPETFTIVASADTTLFSESGETSNGGGDGLFVGQTANGFQRRALVRFDLEAAGVPDGAVIVSATVALTITKTISEPGTIELWRVLQPWGEAGSVGDGEGGGQGTAAQVGDSTWDWRVYPDQPWAAPGGEHFEVPAAAREVSAAGAQAWASTTELVADVQAWVDDPSTNFGWILIGDESQRSAKRFASREHAEVGARPTLTLELYVP